MAAPPPSSSRLGLRQVRAAQLRGRARKRAIIQVLLGSVFLLLLFQAYCGLAAGLVCGSVHTVKRVLQYTRRGAGSAPPQDAEIVPASRPRGHGDEPTTPGSS